MNRMLVSRQLLPSIAVSLLFIFTSLFSYGQQKKVSGKITDDKGIALDNVSVVLKGQAQTQGAVSDANGFFSITVPGEDAILIFSYLGYID
ncbi:MAG: carboxypeptidase-like regulatory domain-containing protein [Chitinophagaceae bacterium]